MGIRGKNSSTEIEARYDDYADIKGTLVDARDAVSSLGRVFQLAASLGTSVFVTVVALVIMLVLGIKEVSRITPYAFTFGIWLLHQIFAAVERGKHGPASKRRRKNKDPAQPRVA
jgi:hypothetical protein